MKIIYKCRCMKHETSIDVPDRRPNTDLMDWMELVQYCMTVDHHWLAPLCRAEGIEYAKIPMDEDAPGIGMPYTKQ